jgi:hypothetical protein
MKSILKYTVFLTTVMLFLFSCEKDDYTGDSKLKPSNPTVTVSGIDPAGYNFIEKDSVFSFDVILSVAQIVDVKLQVTQIAGDATAGADYEIVNSGSEVVIPAYSTTGKLIIKVKSDNIREDTESFTLQIGNETTANASITPVEAVFTIGNYTEDAFVVDMNWTTDIATSIGIEKDPDEVVNMRMLIIDNSTGLIVAVENGLTFETYAAFDTLVDGTYSIATDISSTVDLGDYNAPVNIDLELVFNQAGVINDKVLSFPKVMTNEFPCDAYRTYLATVTKEGSTYTIVKSVSYLVPEVLNWYGTDTEFGYPSQVRTLAGCDLLIGGLNHGWIFDFWGEEIVDSVDVVYTIDVDGIINIPEQDYFTTLYNGLEYLYQIVGTGTLDESGLFPVMHIEYEIILDGFYPGQWSFDNGYMSTPYFVADLTLEPNLKRATLKKSSIKIPLPKKPVR